MRYLSLIICLFFLLGGKARAQITNRVCDTIHYEFIQHKIVIPVTVNGVKAKYIVDTGGRTGTMYDTAVKMGATAAGYMRISDVSSMNVNFQEAHVKNLEIGRSYKVPQVTTMVLPKNPFFEGLGVVGILGGDAFAKSVVTFDARNQIMVINSPYRPEGLKVTDGAPLFTEPEYRSNIDVHMGNATLRVLFDTGAHGFLMYSGEDRKKIGEASGTQSVNHGHGIVAIGIAGLGDPVDIEKVVVPSLKVLGKEFANVGSTTTAMNGSIIGVDLLEYGKVVIDYMRKRFYFMPYDDEMVDMGGAPKEWNVSILPRNGRFEITTLWDSMKDKVAFGDEVIDINGTSLEGFPMSQLAVEEVMDKIEEDTAYIIVRKDGKEQKIEIRREQ